MADNKIDDWEEVTDWQEVDTQPVDDWEEVREDAPADIPADQPSFTKTPIGEVILSAGAQGGSLGTIDEITAGVGAASDYAFDNPYDASIGDIYDVKHDRISKADKKAKEDNPDLYNATEFGAGMLSPAGLLGKLSKLKNLSNVKKAATVGAATGGVAGLGYGEKGKKLQSAAIGAGAGVLLGSLFAKFGEALGKRIARRMGVSDDAIQRYLDDPQRIKNTKFDDVQEAFEEPLKKFQSNLADTGDELAQTRVSLDHAKNRATTAQQGLRREVGEEVYRTGESAKQAKQAFQQELNDTKVPHDVAYDIGEGLSAQRSHTGELAGKQIEYLQNQGKKVKLSELDSIFDEAMKREAVEGVIPDTEDVRRILELKKTVDSVRRRHLDQSDIPLDQLPEAEVQALLAQGDEISPESFMKLRQIIGKQIKSYNQNIGSYKDHGDQLGENLNRRINSVLDNLADGDEYANIRNKLAVNTNMNKDLSKEFGTPDSDQLVKLLQGLADPNNAAKLALLKRLDEKSGGKIMLKLRSYIEAQAKKQNKPELARLLDDLPESQAHSAAQARKRALSQELQDIPEVKEMQFLDNRAALLGQKHKALRESVGDYKRLGVGKDDVDAQNAIRKLMFRNEATKPETRLVEATKRLGNETGEDLLSKIGDLKAAGEFAASGPQGSRLATAGGNIGAAVFSGLGAPGRAVGRGLGSFVGMGLDYGRGKAARMALDMAMSEKMPLAKGLTLAIGQNIDKLVQLADINPQADKYLAILDKAAERGPTAVIAVHQTLSKDPAFKKFVEYTDE